MVSDLKKKLLTFSKKLIVLFFSCYELNRRIGLSNIPYDEKGFK